MAQDLLTLVAFADGAPATEDSAGYSALTWLPCPGVVSLPERGDNFEDVSEATLASGRLEHFNGVADGGELQIPIKVEATDTGRDLLLSKTGADRNDTVSMRETDPDGNITYCYGRVGGQRRRESSTGSLQGYTILFRVNSGRTEVAA